MAPDQVHSDPATHRLIDQIVREYGQSGRTFKSALCSSRSPEAGIRAPGGGPKAARLGGHRGDTETFKRLDESQRRQLDTDTKKAARDLKEAVWRTYKNIVRLGKDNTLQDDRPRTGPFQRGGLAGRV